jgi:multidrug efflux system membrane fusion protein
MFGATLRAGPGNHGAAGAGRRRLQAGTDQTSRYVLVVDKDNVVQQRQVEIGTLVNGMRVVTKGVSTEDWVVTDGIQRAIPGSKVNPQHVAVPPAAAAAPVAPSGSAQTGSTQ